MDVIDLQKEDVIILGNEELKVLKNTIIKGRIEIMVIDGIKKKTLTFSPIDKVNIKTN